jgi:microcin C transport system permease protein
MGYVGGRFDLVVQRLIEIWEQIPFLYVVMIVVSIFRPEFLLFLGIFILFGWTARTWSVRAMTYRERERDYILAARTMGASTWRIVTVHILPNVLVVVLTSLPFAVEGGISALTALDYLGFGLRPPTPSWGELIGQGISVYQTAPWIIASVTVAMTLVLVLIAFVGEGLREAFDPKRYTVYR